MKATVQYFPVVLYITLFRVVLTFEYADESSCLTVQMKAMERCFPVVLYIRLWKVTPTFELKKKSLSCNVHFEFFVFVLSLASVKIERVIIAENRGLSGCDSKFYALQCF